MQLLPNNPPGHGRRKLLAAVSEIKRLWSDGYSTRAIHSALSAAGVTVSLATVQRETARFGSSSKHQEAAQKEVRNGSSKALQPVVKRQLSTAELDAFFDPAKQNPLFNRLKK